MRRHLLTLLALALAGLAAAATPARAATEWVLILDNSASMSTEQPFNARMIPAADPERLAIIATQVFRAFMSADDKLTILNFGKAGEVRVLPPTQADVRGLQFTEGTFFVGPLRRAREILENSTLPRRILVIETDGMPSAEPGLPDTVDGLRQLLGLDPGPAPFEVISLALGVDPDLAANQKIFLAPLGRLEQIDSPRGLIDRFTSIFAESIRSRPESGRLDPGQSHEFNVNKYVAEVLVTVATERPTGDIQASIDASGTKVTPLEAGDSGCDKPPCHAYQVYKIPHDPKRADKWSLNLGSKSGAVAFGIILRYDLAAEIVSAPSSAKIGEEIDVVARLTFDGKTFNDPAFFKADGFAANLKLGDQTVPLTVQGDGTFKARIAVSAAGPGKGQLEAVFTNQWITLKAPRDLSMEEWVPLTLTAKPLDFGAWTGARTPSRRCTSVDLTGSVNADKVPLEAYAEALPGGVRLGIESPLVVKGNKAEVCIIAPGCCSDTRPAANTALVVRGKDKHYHPGAIRVPISFKLAKTPFLVCWWRVIAAVIGAIIFIIIVVGFVRPRDFDREEVIRLAKTEQALARSSARRLRELPGGKRGFYRDARVAFDGSGNAIGKASGATLVLRAAKGDPQVIARGMEEKDPRTRKFQPVDSSKGPGYLRRGVIYRIGEFFFRIG